MRVNYLEPTRAEIGDPFAIMARARSFRERMFARPKPAPKRVEPVLEIPPRRPCDHPLAAYVYAVPIQGPCQPDHRMFEAFMGARDIIELSVTISIADCITYISKTEQIMKSEIVGPWRVQRVAEARQRAMWLARRYAGKTLPTIGKHFGGRDHTTALHAVNKMEARVKSGEWVPPTIEQVAAGARSAGVVG